MSQKSIEDIFNDALGNDGASYQQGDWEKMAELFDNSEDKPVKKERRRKWPFFIIPPFAVLFMIWLIYTISPGDNNKMKDGHETSGHSIQQEDKQYVPATNTRKQGSKNSGEPNATAANKEAIVTQSLNDTNKNEPATGSRMIDENSKLPVTSNTKESINDIHHKNLSSKTTNEIAASIKVKPVKDKQWNAVSFINRNKKRKDIYIPGTQRAVTRGKGVSPDKYRQRKAITGEDFDAGDPSGKDENRLFEKPLNKRVLEIVETHSPMVYDDFDEEQASRFIAQKPTSKLNGLGINLYDDTLNMKALTNKKSNTSGGKKMSLLQRISKTALGLPQWVSVGYEFLPWSATNYATVPDFNSFGAFPRRGSVEVALDSSNLRKMSKGFHIAIGSEWYPVSSKWSLNSYAMMQYAQTRQIARSLKNVYGATNSISDTLVFINNLGALRLGTDWVYHNKNKNLQMGLGLNASFITRSKGDVYDYNYELNINGGGGTSGNSATKGLFRGLRQFNLGLNGVMACRIAKPFWLEARFGYDFLDITRNSYFKNNLRHNLGYFSLGLKYTLQKEK
jgi:hypothetical protein